MRSLRFTPAAKEHLKDIWRYSYEAWGELKADAYLMEIDSKLKSLAVNPKLGRSRPDIKPGYHSIKVNNHLAFYLVSEAHIDVIGVLHEKMDIVTRLKI